MTLIVMALVVVIVLWFRACAQAAGVSQDDIDVSALTIGRIPAAMESFR